MKKLLIYLLSASVGLGLTSCAEDYLEINTDPNAATTTDPGFLFTGVQNGYSTNRTIDYGVAGASWSQIYGPGAFGVFTRPGRYVISVFTNGNTWREHYTGSQKNLERAIDIAESADPINNNGAAQCKIMSSLVYWSSSMIWEDIPYSEAINFDIPQPKLDNQEAVLNGIIAKLDEAIAQIDQESGLFIGNNDLYYSGDMAKWTRLAKSLKFRTLMTMVDADPSKAAAIDAMVSAGDMVGAGDDAMFPYLDVPGNRNPIYMILSTYTGGANICYFGSEATVGLMNDLNDPRREVFYVLPDGVEEYTGIAPGSAGDTETNAMLSTDDGSGKNPQALVRPNSPDPIFTHSEQLLLEAEAHARGFAGGGLAAADEKLRAGITANMEYYKVPAEAIQQYLDEEIPDLTTLGQEEAHQVIAQQQWIDLHERPLEAWTQWRRAEVPELEVPRGAQTPNLIRRLQYPPDEVAANTNITEQKELDAKMWFDK